MAPVVLALRSEPWADVQVLATAQHRQMLDQVLTHFDIKPHRDLDIMRPDQALGALTARLLLEVDDVLSRDQPDVVLVQGDTTTVMAVTLACFYRRIRVGHVEAGLRTGDMRNPFPEEANRVITSRLATWHFAPTESAKRNLLREGVDETDITVSGNTVIDALMMTASSSKDCGLPIEVGTRLVLVTAHRRESFGQPLENICLALSRLAERYPDVQFVYPLHPNPNVTGPATRILGSCPNVYLCPPLEYARFVAVMKQACVILTDSGGVQEEAPALGKPVLVLRDETERPEAVDAGVVKLVGSAVDRIVDETQRLLDDEVAYRAMARGVSPYGDGHAAERIVRALRKALNA